MLRDLIQMECSIKSTRAVRLEREGESGRLYFAHGQVVHAEVGKLSGEPALFEMLSWAGGSYIIADGLQPREETISRSWQALLADAIKLGKGAAQEGRSAPPRRGSGLWKR